MPPFYFPYTPVVPLVGTTIRENPLAGAFWRAHTDDQRAEFLRQFTDLQRDLNEKLMAGAFNQDPLQALTRVRHNLDRLASYNFSAANLIEVPSLVTGILFLFRFDTPFIRQCARTPALQHQQPPERFDGRLALEGLLDFTYLLIHDPSVTFLLVSDRLF